MMFSHYDEVSITWSCHQRGRIYIIVFFIAGTFLNCKQQMDDSRPLAVESFSTSWLSNVKHSYDTTSKMMDYKIVKPSRFLDETQSFKFNTPIHPSVLIAHADELFFDGSIRPVYISHATLGASNTSDFVQVKHNSSLASLTSSPAIQNRCCHSGIWRRSLCMLRKSFRWLNPICHKGDPGEINWVGDIEQKSCHDKSQNQSPRVSPQRDISSSSGDWCHLESSIYEAILHCKKSIGVLHVSFFYGWLISSSSLHSILISSCFRGMISWTKRKGQSKDKIPDFWEGSSMATCSLSSFSLAISFLTSFSKE